MKQHLFKRHQVQYLTLSNFWLPIVLVITTIGCSDSGFDSAPPNSFSSAPAQSVSPSSTADRPRTASQSPSQKIAPVGKQPASSADLSPERKAFPAADPTPPINPASIPFATPDPNPAALKPTIKADSPSQLRSITFPPGITTTALQSKVARKTLDRYTFQAAAGQRAEIILESPQQDVLLTLIDPSGSPIQRYQSGSNRWSGTFSDAGTYTIDAFATGDTTAYTLKIALQPMAQQ